MCIAWSEDLLVRQLHVLTVIVTLTPTLGFASTMLITRISETSDNWTDRQRHTLRRLNTAAEFVMQPIIGGDEFHMQAR